MGGVTAIELSSRWSTQSVLAGDDDCGSGFTSGILVAFGGKSFENVAIEDVCRNRSKNSEEKKKETILTSVNVTCLEASLRSVSQNHFI